MRKRTAAEIKACPHNAPKEHICSYGQRSFRGDYIYKVSGCPLCGGMRHELAMHLNYGRSKRTRADLEPFNSEEVAAMREKFVAWRDALPEPETQ